MKRSKKIISFTMALLLICSILSGCKKDTMPSQDETINVITMSSYEDLKQVDTNALNGRLTVYKVGEMYYAYFPSTNTIEAITAPRAYDYQTAEVVDNLYTNTFIKDGEEYVVSERTVETIEVFGDAVESRIQYISKELDNCSASLVVEDNADIAEYKEQLLSEMEKLIIYQSEISKELKEILIHLDPETQAELAQRISILMDKTFVDSINQYTYAETNNFNTEKTIEALKEIISSQETVIKELSEKYTELEKVLVNKRVYFEQVSDIIDSPEFQEVINSLDTYVNNYVNDCSEEFDRLNTKISALESLYETVKNTDSEKYEDVLTALRTEYQNIIEQQRDLQEQTAYLRDLTGQAVENSESASDINAIISEELEKQQEQLDLLDEIISSSNLKDIEGLAMQQDYLYEYIRQLETVQKTLETTITKEQYEEIKEIRTQLEEISLNGTDTDQLRAYITILQKDMKNLDEETQKAIEELSELLKNTAAGDISKLTKQLNDTIASLDSTIAEQDSRIAEQEKALAAMVKSTTDQLQADIMNSLENSISKQEENLKNEKNALEALISSSGEDLKRELTGVIDTLDAETQAEIDKILSMAGDSSKTEELEAAINALRTDLETDIAAQETIIADNKTALETMVNAKTAQVKTELEALMATADTETQDKIKSVLDKLDASNTLQTEALNNAVTDLQTALNNSVMNSETKLANEKAALEALISSSGADMKSELTAVINTLDNDTQAEIQEVIDLLNEGSANQTTALNDAVTKLEKTLSDDISATEDKLAAEKAALSSLISSSNSELETKLTALIDTTDKDLESKISAVLDALNDSDANQTEALNTAVADLQTALNTKVSETEIKLANEKSALEALISSSDADVKTELTTIINTLNTDTQADIQEVIDLLDSKDTAQTTALNTAISSLEQTLNDDITATEAKIATEKAALSSLITSSNSELKTELKALISTTDTNLQTKITAVLDELDENEAAQTEALDNAISELQTLLNTKVSATETKLENEKAALEALISSSDASMKSELTAVINTLDSDTQADIQEVIDLLDSKDTAQTAARTTAISNLEQTLNNDIAATEAKLASEKSALSTLIANKTSELRTDFEAELSTVSGDLTTLSGDLGDLSEAYNKFISEDYAEYISETDGAINTLGSAIDTLNSDYAAYKTATGNSITDIENLLDVLETDGNNTEAALNNFKTSTNTELSSIKTQVNAEVSNLNTLITDNYNEAQSDISALSAEVADLKTILNGHTTSLNEITARVSELEINLTALETTVNELSDKIDNLINNPYELPPATSSILGGVKVDGSTIAVDPDGTLHVLVGYNTLDEFYAVGTIYDTEDDIRDRIKPYCVKPCKRQELQTVTKKIEAQQEVHYYSTTIQGVSTIASWGYCYKNPFTNEEVSIFSTNLGYENTQAGYYAAPKTIEVSVTGEEMCDIYYVTGNTINNVQVQKLYDAGVITNVSDSTVYYKDLYTYTQKTRDTNNWVYCGIPTIPTTSI